MAEEIREVKEEAVAAGVTVMEGVVMAGGAEGGMEEVMAGVARAAAGVVVVYQ